MLDTNDASHSARNAPCFSGAQGAIFALCTNVDYFLRSGGEGNTGTRTEKAPAIVTGRPKDYAFLDDLASRLARVDDTAAIRRRALSADVITDDNMAPEWKGLKTSVLSGFSSW